MKLLGRSKSKINKYKDGENVPDLKTTELLSCNIVYITIAILKLWHYIVIEYQQDSRLMYIFIRNKLFVQLLGILSKTLIF